MERNSYGKMFVMSSPSGAGKTTLTKKIAENKGFLKKWGLLLPPAYLIPQVYQ